MIVGVDGSTGSQEALEWAAREAAVRHIPLTILAVSPVVDSQWTATAATSPASDALLEPVRQAAQDAADTVIGRLDARPASVTVQVATGFAADGHPEPPAARGLTRPPTCRRCPAAHRLAPRRHCPASVLLV